MSKKLSFFSAACLSLLLSGCAVHGRVDQQLVAEPDPLSLRLAAAVDKASGALETLASVEQARNPGAAIQAVPYAPQELRRTMTVNWTGPIEPIVQRLADRAGYEMQVNGDVPPAPVVVTLTARQKMAFRKQIKGPVTKILAQYVYDTIQGLDAKTLAAAAKDLGAALSARDMSVMAQQMLAVPEKALAAIAERDYDRAVTHWAIAAGSLQKPLNIAAAATDKILPRPPVSIMTAWRPIFKKALARYMPS